MNIQNKQIVNLSILGCCVSRDTFEIIDKETTKYDYKINNFYHVSPISLNSKKIESLQNLDYVNLNLWGGNWWRRILKHDLEKNLFNDINFSVSDYIIIDFYFLQDKLYFTENNQDYFNASQAAINNKSFLERLGNIKLNTIQNYDVPEEFIKESIDKFVDNLKKVYKNEQIILCNWKKASEYISHATNSIEKFNNCDVVDLHNEYFEKYFQYTKSKLPGCHTIEMLDSCIGDDTHKWGILNVHYCSEVYDYIIKSLDIIVSKLPLNQEISLQLILKDIYETKVQSIKNRVLLESIENHLLNNEISIPDEILSVKKFNTTDILYNLKQFLFKGNTILYNSPYSYKLYTMFLIDKLIGESLTYHFFRIDKDFVSKFKSEIFAPFKEDKLMGMDPNILKGNIFAFIGECSEVDNFSLNNAMKNADNAVKAMFLDFDYSKTILFENIELLKEFTPIVIEKTVRNKNGVEREFGKDELFVFCKNPEIKQLLQNYSNDLVCENGVNLKIYSDLEILDKVKIEILKHTINKQEECIKKLNNQ